GATVNTLKPIKESGWRVSIVHTDPPLRLRQPRPYEVRTRFLILAAGTFGSTELLMRSRTRDLEFSPTLGERFSANGDNLSAIYAMGKSTKGVADEEDDYGASGVGPTIT